MLQNNEIYLLPAEISEKIAAGEVVDRPVSIVKELLENSIDAKSQSITVEIKNGGKTYIRVTDDGSGIPANYVETAFIRHATSKIREIKDLDAIGTLGFRGEALSSIAAVSKVEIITKTASEKVGKRLVVEGGKILENGHVGCPEGTTVLVKDLFFNTPARMKFMKNDGAESSLIIDLTSKMSLAYPDIQFRMINNGAVLFSTRGNGDIYNNILTIYSKQIGDKLIKVEEEKDGYSLLAYISPPDISRTSRKGQVYFVNGRNIKDRILESAVSSAYWERIGEGRSPMGYVFLKVPNNSIDVNIHPNKREIRFDDNNLVADFVTDALVKGLKTLDSVADIKLKQAFKKSVDTPPVDTPKDFKDSSYKEKQVDIRTLLSSTRSNNKSNHIKSYSIDEKSRYADSAITIESAGFADSFANNKNAGYTDSSVINEANKEYQDSFHENQILRFDELRPLGSIFATYILAEDGGYFYLIDQHAAHERVFYENLLKQFKAEEKNTQILLAPIILETTHAAANSSGHWISKLVEMGFDIEPFGTKTFIIKGIPNFMELESAEVFLNNFTEEAESEDSIIDPQKLERIITQSCKKAVKGNTMLNMEEIRHLLAELARADNPFSCPHGRPTLLKLSRRDIERLFKRS